MAETCQEGRSVTHSSFALSVSVWVWQVQQTRCCFCGQVLPIQDNQLGKGLCPAIVAVCRTWWLGFEHSMKNVPFFVYRQPCTSFKKWTQLWARITSWCTCTRKLQSKTNLRSILSKTFTTLLMKGRFLLRDEYELVIRAEGNVLWNLLKKSWNICRYKRNLQAFYVVHPSLVSKVQVREKPAKRHSCGCLFWGDMLYSLYRRWWPGLWRRSLSTKWKPKFTTFRDWSTCIREFHPISWIFRISSWIMTSGYCFHFCFTKLWKLAERKIEWIFQCRAQKFARVGTLNTNPHVGTCTPLLLYELIVCAENRSAACAEIVTVERILRFILLLAFVPGEWHQVLQSGGRRSNWSLVTIGLDEARKHFYVVRTVLGFALLKMHQVLIEWMWAPVMRTSLECLEWRICIL